MPLILRIEPETAHYEPASPSGNSPEKELSAKRSRRLLFPTSAGGTKIGLMPQLWPDSGANVGGGEGLKVKLNTK